MNPQIVPWLVMVIIGSGFARSSSFMTPTTCSGIRCGHWMPLGLLLSRRVMSRLLLKCSNLLSNVLVCKISLGFLFVLLSDNVHTATFLLDYLLVLHSGFMVAKKCTDCIMGDRRVVGPRYRCGFDQKRCNIHIMTTKMPPFLDVK